MLEIEKKLTSLIKGTSMAIDEFGKVIDVSDDPYESELILKGELFKPEQGICCDYPSGQCHESVAQILKHEAEEGDILYTGYALHPTSDEWFQHSFLVNNGTIIEPGNHLFKAYFGLKLTGEREIDFVKSWLKNRSI